MMSTKQIHDICDQYKIENYTNALIRFSENERIEKNALSLVNKDMISFLSRNIKL